VAALNRPAGLQECVLDAIRNVLGESTAALVQQWLGSSGFENVEDIHSKLTAMFGPGAKTLERIIVKELHKKLELSYEEKEPFDFRREYRCIANAYGGGSA